MRIVFALALAAIAGCIVHEHPHHPHGGPPGHWRVVVVETGHICSFHCDHFYYDNVWYIIDGHHHGPDCGHYHVDGRWGNMKSSSGQGRKIEEHREVKIQERGPERRPEPPKKEAAPQDKGPKDKEPKKDNKDDDKDKGPKDKGPKGKK